MENSQTSADSKADQPASPEFYSIHYVKAPDCRTSHCDGIRAAYAPTGKDIHLAFYAERSSFPDTTLHRIVDGNFDPHREDQSINTRPGVIREIESIIVVDLEWLKNVHVWLGTKIVEMEELQKSLPMTPPSSSPK